MEGVLDTKDEAAAMVERTSDRCRERPGTNVALSALGTRSNENDASE
jgi:hypothetical protein